VETLKETLRRYISTALPVSRRYPNLQEKIKEIIAQAPLVKGPFVEALPDFEKGSKAYFERFKEMIPSTAKPSAGSLMP